MTKILKNSILALIVLTNIATACSVCDAIKKVESTYKIYKVQKDTYGAGSPEATEARENNAEAHDELDRAKEELKEKHTSADTDNRVRIAATISDLRSAISGGGNYCW